MSQSSPTYGFVGAGELTAAIVTGLSADVTEPPTVFLSPRGREVGRVLAARFPNVHMCDSNQNVLANAQVVVLAVRPRTGRTVVADLAFQPHHVVVSALAGVPLAALRAWVTPATQVVRVIPLPTAAHRQSRTVLFPGNDVARALFERVGDVLVPGGEETLEAFSAATATFAAHLDYLTTIADWLTDHGVERGAAVGYTTHVFGQLGRTLSLHTGSLDALTAEHMTPGGLNEQFLTDLRRDDVPGTVRRALDRVLARLRG